MREGSKPASQELLHYRALAHSDRSSLLYLSLDIDDETCVCDDHGVACIRDMLHNLYRYIEMMMRDIICAGRGHDMMRLLWV